MEIELDLLELHPARLQRFQVHLPFQLRQAAGLGREQVPHVDPRVLSDLQFADCLLQLRRHQHRQCRQIGRAAQPQVKLAAGKIITPAQGDLATVKIQLATTDIDGALAHLNLDIGLVEPQPAIVQLLAPQPEFRLAGQGLRHVDLEVQVQLRRRVDLDLVQLADHPRQEAEVRRRNALGRAAGFRLEAAVDVQPNAEILAHQPVDPHRAIIFKLETRVGIAGGEVFPAFFIGR